MFGVHGAGGVVVQRLNTADGAHLHARSPTALSTRLPFPGDPHRLGALLRVASSADGFGLGEGTAEGSVHHLAVQPPAAAILSKLGPSTAGLGAGRPLLQGPLVAYGVIFQDIVVVNIEGVLVDHVFVCQ